MLLINKIKIWKTVVIDVEWNNPPKIPTPWLINKRYKLSSEIKVAIPKIVIVLLEYNMDLSFLKVIEVDNNNNTNDNSNMKPGEKFEFPLLMHEINVLPIELSWLYLLKKLYNKYNF